MAIPEANIVKAIMTHSHKQQDRIPKQGTAADSRPQKPCRYCGRKHEFKKAACPAVTEQCYICNKMGHFAKQCRSSKAYHIEEDHSDEEEVFFIHTIKDPANQPALVTCTVNDRHKVTFEIGLPVSSYPYLSTLKPLETSRVH